jgi:Ca2+-binding RTX toxin-like protein
MFRARASRRSFRSRNRRTQTRSRAALFEPLEGRTLMSFGGLSSFTTLTPTSPDTVDPTTSFNSIGCLSVQGTTGNDTIVIDHAAGYVDAYVNGNFVNYIPDWMCTLVSVHGRAGDDSIVVRDTVNTHCYLFGDDGNDTVTGSAGAAEDFIGGNGFDDVSYANRWTNLNLSLDGLADDGAAGENDNIHSDIEVVIGGLGNDSITGGWGNDILAGWNGADTLDGGVGDDSLSGGWGNDLLLGNDGDDTMDGGGGSDTFFGGNGVDRADYSNAITPLNVTIDYVANDGEAGENDLVLPDVENVWGGWASDRIVGSAADNVLHGAAGDDTLIGGEGNDTLDGSLGNDRLDGGDGNDDLLGGPHNDVLFAGAGDDVLSGGSDDDTLVSIGGGQGDSLSGDGGYDSFWADYSDTFSQWDWNEYTGGHIHQVYSFADYHFSNGPTIGLSRELDGQNLPDPVGGANYVNYSAQSLFASTGPIKDDIDQNALGDCYFLATLSSIAKTNPDRIRQSVVDLGDGTYAVQFFNGNSPVFVRVDGDLPTNGSGALVYAGLGTGNSLWVAIMEKAWAFYRKNDSNYSSIAGGWPSDAFWALGVSSTTTQSTFGYAWMNRPDLLWNYVAGELGAGKAVVACTPGGSTNLVGNHCYEVDSVYVDGSGTRHIVLRNPWGWAGNPGAYVDLTDAQFLASVDQVDSAYV